MGAGRRMRRRLGAGMLFAGAILAAAPALCSDGVFRDPVVHGAWLFRDSCVRCHVDYGRARLAEEYDGKSDLVRAVGSKGCEIAWSRMNGGPFGRQELEALADYMLKWEELQAEPPLPELPPPALETVPAVMAVPDKPPSEVKGPAPDPDALPPALQHLVATSVIARGGWLYTRNCHRCHLSYEKARMGRGTAPATVQRFITEGKTSTQMRPFAQLLGGSLKNNDIKAIVAYIMRWEEAGEELALAGPLMTPPAFDPSDFKALRLPRFQEVRGDIVLGERLFAGNCSPCHGGMGEGCIGSNLQQPRWVGRADLFLKSVIKSGVSGSIMVGWDQAGGGRLSPRDIDDLVVFLLGLEGR